MGRLDAGLAALIKRAPQQVTDTAAKMSAPEPQRIVHDRSEHAWAPKEHKDLHDSLARGFESGKARVVGNPGGDQAKSSVEHEGHRWILKPYHEDLRDFTSDDAHPYANVSGWGEMTNQSLYHAAGMGDAHQKVHVVHPEDEAGVPHPMIAIHAAPNHEDAYNATLSDHPAPEHRQAAARMGLMDFLTGNHDRHSGNLMLGPNGAPLAIDHGLAFQYDPNHAPDDGVAPYDKVGRFLEDKGLGMAFFGHQGQHRLSPYEGGEREQLWNWWRGASRDVNRTMKERLGLIQDPVVRERIRHHFTERSKHLDRLAAMDAHHEYDPRFHPFAEKLAWPE